MIRGNKGGLPPAAMQTSKPSHAGARRNATDSISRPGDEVVTDPGGIDPNTGRVAYADRNPNHYAANRQRVDQQNTYQGATPQQANHRALYAERHPNHAAGMQQGGPRQPQQGGMQPPQSPPQLSREQWQQMLGSNFDARSYDLQNPQQGQQLPPMQGGLSGGFGPMQGRPTYDPGFGALQSPFQNPKFAGPGSSAMQQMGGGMWGGGQMMPARNTGPAPMQGGGFASEGQSAQMRPAYMQQQQAAEARRAQMNAANPQAYQDESRSRGLLNSMKGR